MDQDRNLKSNHDPSKRSVRSSEESSLPNAYDRGVRDSTHRLRQLIERTYIEQSSNHAEPAEPVKDDFLPGLSQPVVSSRTPHPAQSTSHSKKHRSMEIPRPVLARSRSAHEERVESLQKFSTRPRNRTISDLDREQASPNKRQSRQPDQPTINERSPRTPTESQSPNSGHQSPENYKQRAVTEPPLGPALNSSPLSKQPGQQTTENLVHTPPAPPSSKFLAHLMNRTRGQMQGILFYCMGSSKSWIRAYCILNAATGSLLRDLGSGSSTNDEVVLDLHGCKVHTSYDATTHAKTIHVKGKGQQRVCNLRPGNPSEFNAWFAALLCWQAVKQPKNLELDLSDAQLTPVAISTRRDRRRSKEDRINKDSSIVRTSKFGLWCREDTTEPIFRESSIGASQRSSSGRPSSWMKISCILQESGDFRLMAPDAKEVTMISLAKLPRSAIQRLSLSVLKSNHVIAIFPQYSTDLPNLSRLQPLYLRCETKQQYELWFVLLRAFTVPELYGPPKNRDADSLRSQEALPGLSGISQGTISSLFRVERSLELQILEYRRGVSADGTEIEDYPSSNLPSDSTNTFAGHYAQVLVDGIVRSKTRPKSAPIDTAWYESFDILDLPPTASFVTIQVRRLKFVQESFGQQAGSILETQIPPPLSGEEGENSITSDELVGEMVLPLSDAHTLADDLNNRWSLIDQEGQTVKTLSLKARLYRDIVLADQEYSVLSELLHDFSNALTLQIADMIPTELSKLSDCLLNIFQVSGGAKEWLISLAEEEIDGIRQGAPSQRFGFNATLKAKDSRESLAPQEREGLTRDMTKATIAEANLLFRGNTLLSKALDAHMQRLGREYLEEALGPKIREIAELDQDVEVDPAKISATASLHFNWLRLLDLVRSVWSHIRISASKCPGELRAIFRHIKACAEEKYAYCLKTVPYSSVSGFLFLRFFCPAILNPMLFDLIDDYPRPRAQRSFTLIAKTLQGLANQSTFGSKEPWMEPMNNFLNKHKTDFRDFIDEICIYSSTGTSSSGLQEYSVALSTFSRLPPICKEGYLSLPYLIDETRGFAALVEIWLENFTPHSMNQPLDYELLQFHNECLNLRKKTRDLFRHAERSAKRSGTLEEKWNGLIQQMQTNPGDFWIGFAPRPDEAVSLPEHTTPLTPSTNDEGTTDTVAFATDPAPRTSIVRNKERQPSAAKRWRSRSRSRTASPLRTSEYDSGPSGAEEEPAKPEPTSTKMKSREGKRHGLFGRRRKSDR